MRPLSQRARAIAVTIAAALTLIGVSVVAVLEVGDDGKPKGTVTITVGKPKAPGAVETVPTKIKVSAGAVRQAADVGDHEALKTEDPAGADRDELAKAREQQDRLAQTDALPIVTPDAAPSQRGCTTRLVGNFSSRRGVRPRLLVVHYTVSANRPGWDDVWSIAALFDRAAFQASSNYVLDDEAHCAYIVRESDKAWTQAAANPVSISVEVIATGREGRLTSAAGFARLGRVFADAGKRWAIPLQAGAVNGCTVARAGIIDHHALGACGGGHVDVSPYSVAPVIAAARKAAGATSSSASSPAAPANVRRWCEHSRSTDAKANAQRLRLVARRGWECKSATPVRHKISTTDRRTCDRLQAWRKAGRPARDLATNVHRRKALESRGVYCPWKAPPRLASTVQTSRSSWGLLARSSWGHFARSSWGRLTRSSWGRMRGLGRWV